MKKLRFIYYCKKIFYGILFAVIASYIPNIFANNSHHVGSGDQSSSFVKNEQQALYQIEADQPLPTILYNQDANLPSFYCHINGNLYRWQANYMIIGSTISFLDDNGNVALSYPSKDCVKSSY